VTPDLAAAACLQHCLEGLCQLLRRANQIWWHLPEAFRGANRWSGSNLSWNEAPFETKETLLLLPTASGSQSRIAKCLDLVVLQNRQCLFANLFDQLKLFSADAGCTHLAGNGDLDTLCIKDQCAKKRELCSSMSNCLNVQMQTFNDVTDKSLA